MNRIFVCIAISFITIGCVNNREKKNIEEREIKLVGYFKLSSFADSLLMDYIKLMPNQPAYAMFIDKRGEQKENFVLTIAPFFNAVKNIDESGAMNYFILQDSTPVFIYSGVEDFVLGSSTFEKSKERPKDVPEKGEFKYFDPIRRKVNFLKSRSFIQNDTISYIVDENSFPFSNMNILPTRNWIAPQER